MRLNMPGNYREAGRSTTVVSVRNYLACMPNSSGDQRTPRATSDGSMTLHSELFGQTYHSRHGALTESLHVFIEAGWARRTATLESGRTMRVLELGLGTGLNALLTRRAHAELPGADRPDLLYEALEPHPLEPDEWRAMSLATWSGVEGDGDLHAHPEADRHEVEWGPGSRFIRHRSSWQDFAPVHERNQGYDLIYFDAFAPESQPELWLPERFEEAFRLLSPGGILVTYCAKGTVRRAMMDAGFKVERLPGPPGKREMIRATRPPWDEMTLRRFNVRVYLFLLDRPLLGNGLPDPESRILLSDEFLAGRNCTKLPGGGLEFGEGPMECARREAREELGQPIDLGPLVHATGDFIRSDWRGDEQVLCQYYLATLPEPAGFRVADARFDYPGPDRESFRWGGLESLTDEEFTFGVDRSALSALRGRMA